ncbi:MAG: hypothetical protein A2902_00165 [Elusimicrobia bacterium RIFCSPLOWO2_01_FULL_64_13]|nr:MAG: hypothetical protein A2902_00165 [Elusimicrobia bacterium RIFCSPLOWO2_01_FULL_64_13]
MNPKKILVTGGAGLLGSALKGLCPEAVYVTREDADLTDPRRTRELFESIRPEAVLHCSARVGGVKINAEKGDEMFAENVQINASVLSAARISGVKKLISVLSSCAYPDSPDRPLSEDDLHRGFPFHGHLGYAYSKRALDVLTRLISERHGLAYTTITPATMFGPHDSWDLDSAHVIGALISKCRDAKRNATALEVWGSGRAVRQFICSADVARVMLALLDRIDGPRTTIVAPDEGISIRTLAETIARAMDFRGPVVFDESKPEGQAVRVLKSGRFEKLFPDFKFTPLEKALGETARWFESNVPAREKAGKR